MSYTRPRRNRGRSAKRHLSLLPISIAVAIVQLFAGFLFSARAAVTVVVSGNVVPADPSTWTSSTTAYVGNTSSGVLTVSSGTINSSSAYVGYGSASTGTVTIDSAASAWSNVDFIVGESGRGTLNITNGATAGRSGGCYGLIGNKSGSTGTVNVDGNGSTWGKFSSLSIGTAGNGTMNVTNGGKVTSGGGLIGNQTGSTGLVKVDGVGANWAIAADSYYATDGNLYVGSSGNGSLVISNGGTVTSGGYWGDAVGRNAGSCGAVTISGAGSLWTSVEDLYIGSSGIGSLIVSDGGAVITGISGAGIAGGACIGYQAGSAGSVIVDGPSSTWNSKYGFSVGYSGNGTLTIRNGGKVTAGPYIGNKSGSSGTVNVDGAGSTWMPSALYVGYAGTGMLNISNGGAVTVDGTTYLAYRSGSTGTINFGLGGGTLTTKMLWAKAAALTGTGTIATQGIVTDVDLVYDATHGANQSFVMNRSGQNLTVNLDLTNANPTTDLGVGYAGSGSLTVRDGVTINSQFGYLAYQAGSTAAATVDGPNSTWNLTSVLYVGYGGTATLRISNGGTVGSTLASGGIAYNAGSSGTVIVDGAGSVWNIPRGYNNVFAVGGGGNGELQISNGGVVSSLYAYGEIAAGPGSTGKVTVDGVGSAWNSYEAVYVAYYGNATLRVTGGAVINSASGIIAYALGSSGIATVDGAGSKWNASAGMNIGSQGKGTLRITNGGVVASISTNASSSVAKFGNSTGMVAVDGAGSTWSAGKTLSLGGSGGATLNITGGGTVTTGSVTVSSKSLIAIDVGRGSTLNVGSGGTLSNNGIIRILGGAGVPADGVHYLPISAGTWAGTGTCQAIGGTWKTTDHTFTASHVISGASGSVVTIDLASDQRILVDDNGPGGTNWEIGASFPAATSPSPITLTATAISGTTLDALQSLLPANQSILGGWSFSVTSYAVSPSNPVYLSFNVGAGYRADNINLWQYVGSTWAPYNPTDLTYDGIFASFTATSINSFAVAGVAVPEPASLTILGTSLLSLLALAWRWWKPRIGQRL